jgi:SAM-dependent methyltransferase
MTRDCKSPQWDAFYAEELSLTGAIANLSGHTDFLEAIEASSPSRLLEVGVGTGTMSWFFGARGIETVGLDSDEQIVARARSRAGGVGSVTYQVGDAFELSSLFPRDHFDVAFSQGLFEHFEDEEIRELARQQLSVARRVLLSVPSDQYPRFDFGNERLMSPDRWAYILGGVGCVRAEYYGLLSHGLRDRLRGKPPREYMHVLVSIDPSVDEE